MNFDRLWIGTDLEYGKKIDTAAIKLETDKKLFLSTFEKQKLVNLLITIVTGPSDVTILHLPVVFHGASGSYGITFCYGH